jgi:hypothetical protein
MCHEYRTTVKDQLRSALEDELTREALADDDLVKGDRQSHSAVGEFSDGVPGRGAFSDGPAALGAFSDGPPPRFDAPIDERASEPVAR